LILTNPDPVKLTISGEDDGEADEILALRDEILLTLQDRSLPIAKRIDGMLNLCETSLPMMDMGQWTELLLSLERLDERWSSVLTFLCAQWKNADYAGFDAYMADRQTEYEQLLCYFVYRHFANGADFADAAARAAFAALAYEIVHAVGAAVWTVKGDFSIEAQIALARLFSSEIEYSEENLDFLLDELYDPYA
jgi:lysine-N-methylase